MEVWWGKRYLAGLWKGGPSTRHNRGGVQKILVHFLSWAVKLVTTVSG